VDGHEFIHGSPVESNGKFYTLHHEKIYRTDSKGTITLDEAHHPTEKEFWTCLLLKVFGDFLSGGFDDCSVRWNGKIL
jgi:hypothetical protein